MNHTNHASKARLLAGILGPVLLAIGTSIPTIKSSLGHTYSVVGAAAISIYLIAICVLTFNVLSDKLPAEIAKRLQLVAISLLVGTVLYGLYHGKEGMTWFKAQTVFEMPASETTKQDVFWNTLNEFTGSENLPFGGLRAMYRVYGPTVVMNDSAIYQETINSLSQDQLEVLMERGGARYRVIPLGILAYLASLLLQIFAAFRGVSAKRALD